MVTTKKKKKEKAPPNVPRLAPPRKGKTRKKRDASKAADRSTEESSPTQANSWHSLKKTPAQPSRSTDEEDIIGLGEFNARFGGEDVEADTKRARPDSTSVLVPTEEAEQSDYSNMSFEELMGQAPRIRDDPRFEEILTRHLLSLSGKLGKAMKNPLTYASYIPVFGGVATSTFKATKANSYKKGHKTIAEDAGSEFADNPLAADLAGNLYNHYGKKKRTNIISGIVSGVMSMTPAGKVVGDAASKTLSPLVGGNVVGDVISLAPGKDKVNIADATSSGGKVVTDKLSNFGGGKVVEGRRHTNMSDTKQHLGKQHDYLQHAWDLVSEKVGLQDAKSPQERGMVDVDTANPYFVRALLEYLADKERDFNGLGLKGLNDLGLASNVDTNKLADSERLRVALKEQLGGDAKVDYLTSVRTDRDKQGKDEDRSRKKSDLSFFGNVKKKLGLGNQDDEYQLLRDNDPRNGESHDFLRRLLVMESKMPKNDEDVKSVRNFRTERADAARSKTNTINGPPTTMEKVKTRVKRLAKENGLFEGPISGDALLSKEAERSETSDGMSDQDRATASDTQRWVDQKKNKSGKHIYPDHYFSDHKKNA